jgi:hypothetical protein
MIGLMLFLLALALFLLAFWARRIAHGAATRAGMPEGSVFIATPARASMQ